MRVIQVNAHNRWEVVTFDDGHSEVNHQIAHQDWMQWSWLSWDMSADDTKLPQVAKNLVYQARNGLRHCFRLHRSYRLGTWGCRSWVTVKVKLSRYAHKIARKGGPKGFLGLNEI